jgi:hypothetical protein
MGAPQGGRHAGLTALCGGGGFISRRFSDGKKPIPRGLKAARDDPLSRSSRGLISSPRDRLRIYPFPTFYFLFPFFLAAGFLADFFLAAAFGLRAIQSITASPNAEQVTSFAPFIKRAKS